jgi:phosphate transport system protein
MPKDHIVHAFDMELSNLEKLIVEMGGRVEMQLDKAINGLLNYDVETAKEVIADDKIIDRLELEVATKATEIFATRQPMADDLRSIVAALKISSNLERMGDYAKNISKRTITLSQIPLVSITGKSVRRMGDLVSHMMRDVLDAYVARDADKALDVIVQDHEVDQLHTSLFREILTYMMEDARNITACTHLLFIAKNVERIGDHTTNIGEQVYYIKTGNIPEEERDTADKATSVIVEKSD